VIWNRASSVEVRNVGFPLLMEPGDAIVRITTSGVCGSDLHMYHNEVPGSGVLRRGDILGHEGVGIIEAVGSQVQNFKVGDRVVISAIIMCGACKYCKMGKTSLCSGTNPSLERKENYGHSLAGIFGSTAVTGAYDGLQAEHARVPLADSNLLKLPDTVSDEAAITLSDVCCTAWHSLDLAEADNNTNSLAIWGCGPVGLMAIMLAKSRGVKRVLAIDHHAYRLDRARALGAETFNSVDVDVVRQLLLTFPEGVEKCIDCGYSFSKKGLFTKESFDVIGTMIDICEKGGHVVVIGDYFHKSNSFPVGALMEKAITFRGGQLWVQKDWQKLVKMIESREIDPTILVTHCFDLACAAEAYKIFNKREEGAIKVLLRTPYYYATNASSRAAFPIAPKLISHEKCLSKANASINQTTTC